MPKKVYLGQMEADDLMEFYSHRDIVLSLNDLKRTLKDPNEVVHNMMSGISPDDINQELADAIQKRDKKFPEIFSKYEWFKNVGIKELRISREGKVYKYLSDSEFNF